MGQYLIGWKVDVNKHMFVTVMQTIPFPATYKNAILGKRKTVTVRVGDEMGKYKQGAVYRASSYAGTDWGVSVRIVSVQQLPLGELGAHGLPKRSVQSLKKQMKLNNDTRVELFRFAYVGL